MAFETFTGARVVTKEPRVTILKQGNFNFNTGTMQILRAKNITHFQLLYDRDTNRIAFKPCTKTDEGAYALREVKGIGQLSGTSFLKFCKIPLGEQTRSYPAAWNVEQGMLIIDLG